VTSTSKPKFVQEKNHVCAILKARKVTNRTEAVIAVFELRWGVAAGHES
jgi:hypothetical protein